MYQYKKILRFVALFLAINILVESIAPYTAFALTSGPTQPEFSSFEPVATTNMVDPFTGGFTYNLPVINVPGPNGSGYGVSLSYHSGASMEDESSWVGHGWSLNPGAINRNKSGFPDDVKGGAIQYQHDVPPIYTVAARQSVSFEGFSADAAKTTSISASTTRTFNSYKGFGRTSTFGVGVMNGIASLSFTVGDGTSSFSPSVSPAALIAAASGASSKKSAASTKKNKSGVKGVIHSAATGMPGAMLDGVSAYGMQALYEMARPTTVEEYKAYSIAIDVTLGVTPSQLPFSAEFGVEGNYAWQLSNKSDKFGYGSMYQADAIDDATRMMDCFVEKESYYNKRDITLPIPYNAIDAYSVMGEGISGGFKYKNDQVGHYFPTPLESKTVLRNGSVEATVGLNIKPLTGLGLAVGLHKLKTNHPYGNGNYNDYSFSKAPSEGRENGFFRFNGDLSNYISYSPDANDNFVAANVGMLPTKYTDIPYGTLFHEYETVDNETQRAYRSSYIGYTTYEDFNTAETSNNYYLRSYTRDAYTRNLVARSKPSEVSDDFMESQIAEMYSVTEAGGTYVYGLPVLSYQDAFGSKGLNVAEAKYTSMSYTDTENGKLYNSLTRDALTNAVITNTDVAKQQDYNISETHNYPYATSYLLTQIQTADYVDRTFNGPTSDDLGGWTKFNYVPASVDYTDNANWFGWRIPYQGYEYSRGTLSHTIDDMLHYSEGKKQQYFLETVETKTHIAFFVTNLTDITVKNENGDDVHIKGSLKSRIDGASTAMGTAASQAPVSQTARKLERIILFAKNDQSTDVTKIVSGKPLKIVNLEYYGYSQNGTTAPSTADKDKALCHGIPNKLQNTTDNPFNQDGKLTLKRVWFEYEGIINAKISPYEFYYEYKNNWNLPAALQTKYSAITGYASALTSANQNPDYNSNNTDAWGNYIENGIDKKIKMSNTVDQIASATYDPAAWQLKRIVMPSGGEMLVQYEQGDYKFVHNQRAMVLTALKASTTSETEGDVGKAYYLDLNSIGITSQADIDLLYPKIVDYLTDNKLYFKFLYSLNGTSTDVKDCNVEYITGYATAVATKDANGIYVKFVTGSNDKYTVPFQVCRDFFKKERNGLNLSTDCSNKDRIPVEQVQNDSRSGVLPAMHAVIAMPGTDESAVCKTISLTDSYLRIPVLYAKKGGPARVKRIMMFDPGLETGDQMLYGSEYIYKLADNKSSSGVATNEPLEMHEENALVNFLQKRAPQSWIKKVTSGVDKEQFEGPTGEGLLSAASIGYSRIVIKNIHSGKTNTGFTVQEFFTAADHPISEWKGDKSSLCIGISKFRYFPGIFVNCGIDKRYASQGYGFVLYDIHGKPKRVATFKGNYDETSSADQEANTAMSYEEIYTYTKPGEQVNVLDYNGVIRSIPMGRDEEIAIEMRSISDIADDYSLKVDFDMGLYEVPVPMGSGMINIGTDEKEMNTHVINKVVRYTPILKKTTLFKDGVTHVTENKVFSISNGKPLITVNYDGYDNLALQQDPAAKHRGTVTSYAVPADYIYKNLSGKFKNEKLSYTLKAVTISNNNPAVGKYQVTLLADFYNKGYCAVGDLIKISSGSNFGYCYVVGLDKQGSDYTMVIQTLPNTSLNGALVGSSLDLTVFVLHSGFENQLNNYVASVSTYGDNPDALVSPLILSNGQNKLRSFATALEVSTQTYSGVRPSSALDNIYAIQSGDNDYLAGRVGNWRPFETYTQKKAITAASSPATARVYSAGTFSSDVFDFDPIATNNLWTKINTVTLYSPDGNPLEEKNVMNIYSAAKMSYGGNVPVLVAKNSQYSTSYFNGFEEFPKQTQMGTQVYQYNYLSTITKGIAHSGSQSLMIPSQGIVNYSEYNSNAGVSDYTLGVNAQLVNKGIMTRFWVKLNDGYAASGINNSLSVTGINASGNVPFILTEIARVGEWSLIEGVISKNKSAAALASGTGFTIQMSNVSGKALYIDDIRMQPYDAEMACYVYDPKNLRLLASFDDQHFAILYQYNAEGKLLRKLVETEKGVKTIMESQFNTPQKTY